MSKGSGRRPPAIDAETERANWERTFGAKKYLVCPGVVVSRNDGQAHFIDAPRLIQLYGVDPAECVTHGARWMPHYAGLVQLHPREDGEYDLL